jgi:ferritin-like protein
VAFIFYDRNRLSLSIIGEEGDLLKHIASSAQLDNGKHEHNITFSSLTEVDNKKYNKVLYLFCFNLLFCKEMKHFNSC